MKTIKTIITALLLIISITIDASAFKILTGINDLSRSAVVKQDGSVDYTLFDRLKSDGIVCMLHKTFSIDEKLEILKHLGPGIMATEDGAFTTVNYEQFHNLAGYIDLYVSYNEHKWGHRFDPYTPYSVYDIYKDGYETVLSDEEIEWILQDLARKGFYDVPLMILARHYYSTGKHTNDSLVDVINHALNNKNIIGALIEMNPTSPIRKWGIDALIRKTLDMGKSVVLYMQPHNSIDFYGDVVGYMCELRGLLDQELMDSDNFYVVVSNYGPTGVSWFGGKNSIEGVVNFLLNDFDNYRCPIDGGCFINTLGF